MSTTTPTDIKDAKKEKLGERGPLSKERRCRNWMVALDESPNAYYAFQFACANMQKDDHLFLVSAAQEALAGNLTTKSRRKRARKIVAFYNKEAEKCGISCTLIIGQYRHVGEVLCLLSERLRINHLILGRRSMNDIQRLLVGSTSRYVVENANCNVAVVRQPLDVSEEECISDEWLTKRFDQIHVKTSGVSLFVDDEDLWKKICVHGEGKQKKERKDMSYLYVFLDSDKQLKRKNIVTLIDKDTTTRITVVDKTETEKKQQHQDEPKKLTESKKTTELKKEEEIKLRGDEGTKKKEFREHKTMEKGGEMQQQHHQHQKLQHGLPMDTMKGGEKLKGKGEQKQSKIGDKDFETTKFRSEDRHKIGDKDFEGSKRKGEEKTKLGEKDFTAGTLKDQVGEKEKLMTGFDRDDKDPRQKELRDKDAREREEKALGIGSKQHFTKTAGPGTNVYEEEGYSKPFVE